MGTALLALLILPGCSSDDPALRAVSCPQVAIVRDAAEVMRFTPGSRRDLGDLVVRGVLENIQGACDYTSDGVTVAFKINLVAERGPKLPGNQTDFRYFVAVVKPDGTPWRKEEFSATVTFEDGRKRAGSVEDLEQELPIGKDVDGAGYQVLLGFQLTPEELEWNRRPLERPVPRLPAK